MKKHLKEELIALAEGIVKNQQEELKIESLKNQARELYEKLTVLHFTEKNLAASNVSEEENKQEEEKVEKEEIVEEASEEKKEEKESMAERLAQAQRRRREITNVTEEEDDEYAPDGTQFNDSEAITEPNTEKIKDIVAQMPPETGRIDEMINEIKPNKTQKNDMGDIGGVHYDQLPQFEPLNSRSREPEKPKSLNDRLKKGIQVGLNDRHAFIKHLFGGSNADYNRVLSQLNTIKSKEEATNFVMAMVKPDYNNWEGKEEYEIRFLAIVESKFE